MSDEGVLRFEYGAVPSNDGSAWSAAWWLNGRPMSVVAWHATRADALSAALAEVQAERARYVGDWDVTIEERKP